RLVGVGVASTSLMKYQWQLILMWGVVVGAGAGFLASVLAATIATRWFTERRGLVTGILSGASSTGQLLFLPILANVTVVYGWRTTVIVITAVVCVVLPIVALLMRDRPSVTWGSCLMGRPANPSRSRLRAVIRSLWRSMLCAERRTFATSGLSLELILCVVRRPAGWSPLI